MAFWPTCMFRGRGTKNLAEEEFTVKVAKTLDEACQLLEVDFDYVCDMEGAKLFRKRKCV